MKTIRIKSPATSANVGPGYDIFALTLKAPWDEIVVSIAEKPGITISVSGNNSPIPCNPSDNTAGLAVLELLKRKNLSIGVDIHICKKMPSGGGLGTTGASAAGAIFGLNKLLDLKLSNNEMIDIARMGEVASGGSPHADNVAASLLGGFVLVKSYNPIDALKLEIAEFPVVLAVIRKSQRTTRGFITYEIGQEKLKDQMARCARVIHAIYSKDIREFGEAINVDHIAEPVRSAAIPGYAEVKKAVLNKGAHGFTVSGGGSSVIAVCDKCDTEEIARIMRAGFADNPNFVDVIISSTSNTGVSVME
ncbi:MAG: homoserine kinase [Bacteroidetes bacterium]|nr:homoserine kinase [Bacteroidota bacterium]MBU1719592.1 homoserine kinase [Bacteroidota bacterium]